MCVFSHSALYDTGFHEGCSSFTMMVSSVLNSGIEFASSLSDIKFVN